MSLTEQFLSLVDSIYEAALDNDLWPSLLVRLADALGAADVGMPSMDRETNTVSTIAPRLDPELVSKWKSYWAFNDPVLARALEYPLGEVCTVDDLMPREEFIKTPVYNEFWRPAQYSLAAMGARLYADNQFSSMIVFLNAPGKDVLSEVQKQTFGVLVPHLTRAVRINRRLWDMKITQIASEEQLETLPHGAFLVDAEARVVMANSAGSALINEGDALFFDEGRLAALGGKTPLRKIIASCDRAQSVPGGPGGELTICRNPGLGEIHVTIAPLRSRLELTGVPWIEVGAPVAIVIAADPDRERKTREEDLRGRFGLTVAESELASEILKGDGRAAAARRCRISDSTAKTHLASIFSKTGTHRQGELIRLLLNGGLGSSLGD
ncbi:MAG TPA: helix-turn-helix transcriptional regulator [Methylocella sp.]|nr:helix-turn-helix transcriptional regulator [Methylocella sp.]